MFGFGGGFGLVGGSGQVYNSPGGALPWGGGAPPPPAAASGSPWGVAKAYQQSYNNALAMNQANYNNILQGYQQAIAQQTSAQQAISSGYTELYNNVLGKISETGEAQKQTIDRNFAQNLARTSQQLIDRGLGNTTIQASVNQGNEGERAYQQTQLADSQARLSAQAMSQLGQAGLANRQQGIDNLTGLAARQLDFMNSVTAKYPDAGQYGNLAQQLAQQEQLRKANPYASGGGSFAGRGGSAPQLGYVPSRPYFGSGGGDTTLGGGGGAGMSYLQAMSNPYAANPAFAQDAGSGYALNDGSRYADAAYTGTGGGFSAIGFADADF